MGQEWPIRDVCHISISISTKSISINMILFYSRKYLSKNHKININIYKYLMKFFSFKNQFQEPQAEMFLRIEGFQVSFFWETLNQPWLIKERWRLRSSNFKTLVSPSQVEIKEINKTWQHAIFLKNFKLGNSLSQRCEDECRYWMIHHHIFITPLSESSS